MSLLLLACILPTVKVPDFSCEGTNSTILPGKPVVLITINRRFELHQPLHVRQTCQHQWTPDLKDLLRSGYWPATVTSSTLYTLDLLNSFQDLKVISPGFSRQAFAKLLEHRTKIGGRTCQRLQDETARLAELKTELLCTDEVVAQWLSDVKEWAAGDSSMLCHRLRRKLADDKKLLLQETEKYSGLVLDSATNTDVAVVEHSLTGIYGRGRQGEGGTLLSLKKTTVKGVRKVASGPPTVQDFFMPRGLCSSTC
ncbi:hypothetical protein G5714_022024 [Onychostoma macrolepis]|uniref:CxC3 like cysteine cluster domain-containing protein n=1 Tax=Onychostoma macrolepis TaxID=369639 RepID=A0A7J6BSR2_9TELE|nr:hypothetical protein G5714_022024 [Onychostoma macrolepis]